METFYEGQDPIWTSEALQDPPEQLPRDTIECLREVNEGHIQSDVLFPTLLLELPGNEDLIAGSFARPETTL